MASIQMRQPDSNINSSLTQFPIQLRVNMKQRERVQMLLDYGESSFASSTMKDQSVHVVLSLDVGLHHIFKAHLGMVPWAVTFKLNIVAFQLHGLIPHPME